MKTPHSDTPLLLRIGDRRYPLRLAERLGAKAPVTLTALGNSDLLVLPKTALFCSAHCPGSAILAAYDQAAQWRDAGRCIISGFHSPIERECLRILLRGKQPVILCPARSLPKRLPPEWQEPLTDSRLLLLSAFPDAETRVTAALAERRNELVAALADDAYFAHITPGGHAARLAGQLKAFGVALRCLEERPQKMSAHT